MTTPFQPLDCFCGSFCFLTFGLGSSLFFLTKWSSNHSMFEALLVTPLISREVVEIS